MWTNLEIWTRNVLESYKQRLMEGKNEERNVGSRDLAHEASITHGHYREPTRKMQALFWTQIWLHSAHALRMKFKFQLNSSSSLNFKSNLLRCLGQGNFKIREHSDQRVVATHCSTQGDRGQRQDGRIQERQFDERKNSGEFKLVANMLSKVKTKMWAARKN